MRERTIIGGLAALAAAGVVATVGVSTPERIRTEPARRTHPRIEQARGSDYEPDRSHLQGWICPRGRLAPLLASRKRAKDSPTGNRWSCVETDKTPCTTSGSPIECFVTWRAACGAFPPRANCSGPFTRAEASAQVQAKGMVIP